MPPPSQRQSPKPQGENKASRGATLSDNELTKLSRQKVELMARLAALEAMLEATQRAARRQRRQRPPRPPMPPCAGMGTTNAAMPDAPTSAARAASAFVVAHAAVQALPPLAVTWPGTRAGALAARKEMAPLRAVSEPSRDAARE